MRVIERFTLIDRDTILYESTMEDPKVGELTGLLGGSRIC